MRCFQCIVLSHLVVYLDLGRGRITLHGARTIPQQQRRQPVRVRAVLFHHHAHEIVKERLVGGAVHGRAGALLKPLQTYAVNERARLRRMVRCNQ